MKIETQAEQETIQHALSILERVASELCQQPIKMDVDIGNNMVMIQFTVANNSESRRLVGSGGSVINALYTLARLMFKRTGKVVQLNRVQCVEDVETAHKKFQPKENWPRKKLESLLLDVAATSFSDRKVRVEVRDTVRNNSGTQFIVFMSSIDDEDSEAFGKAIATLFVPVGINNGRRIFADIRGGR